ncbi:hypothetical protein BGY98DRAFT_1186968 [Russula aff. rugulosa BPL654]|nr:hypothetical protein BGY98DRAFT_1186968 [Russula aff. rugulosa BPL654]
MPPNQANFALAQHTSDAVVSTQARGALPPQTIISLPPSSVPDICAPDGIEEDDAGVEFLESAALRVLRVLLPPPSSNLCPMLFEEGMPYAPNFPANEVGSHKKNVHPITYIGNRPAWLLDYIVRDVGTVVPQSLWSPPTTTDAQRYSIASLNMPIFFIQRDRTTLGLPLNQAATGNCSAILNAHQTAPVGDCHTTFIRIMWPGYNEWSTQIMMRDQTPAHNTIPIESLAARVARAVCRLLQNSSGHQCMSPNWTVGRGGITADDIILVGLIQVIQGSWQPILQLNRYIFSQSPN